MPVYNPITRRERAEVATGRFINNLNLDGAPSFGTVGDIDFSYLLAKNRIRGLISSSSWSYSLPLETQAFQDLIPFTNFSGGMTRVLPFEPATIRIDVDNVEDGQNGDGARALVLVGLDAAYGGGNPYIKYTITMPSTAGPPPWYVETPTSERLLRLLSMEVISAGSANTNIGTITASQLVSGNYEPQLQIEPGYSRAYASSWTVPVNWEGYIPSIYVSWSGPDDAEFQVISVNPTTDVRIVEIQTIISQTTTGRNLLDGFSGIHLPERADVFIRGRRTTGSPFESAQVSFSLILDHQPETASFPIPI